MNYLFFLILLITGVVLVFLGINSSNSISSDISNLFTGLPTDKAIWMLVGGILLAVVGLAGTFRRTKHA